MIGGILSKLSAHPLAYVDTDFDNAEVAVTTIASADNGLIYVDETTGNVAAWYVNENGTLNAVYANSAYTTTKDTGAKYNVYFEGGVLKIQNNVGNNKYLKVGWFGV